jgi:hypothetical protein
MPSTVSSKLSREADRLVLEVELDHIYEFDENGCQAVARNRSASTARTFPQTMTLKDYVHKLAYNQHGGVMGYVRNSVGLLDGPRILDVFVVDQKLTCAELEKAAARGVDDELDREMGFRGRLVTWPDGPLLRLLDCGDMLIGLDD